MNKELFKSASHTRLKPDSRKPEGPKGETDVGMSLNFPQNLKRGTVGVSAAHSQTHKQRHSSITLTHKLSSLEKKVHNQVHRQLTSHEYD